jgi:hypothetical protein
MNQQELKERYRSSYEYMANSKNTEYMMYFGKVMSQMMDDMIASNPAKAEDYIDKLCAIKWNNYLTPKEADMIVSKMEPKAPWGRDQWKAAMLEHEFPLEEEPFYNRCAMYVTMSMICSDSIDTLTKYAGEGDMFEVIHALALDKLKDPDGVYNVRHYFRV